MARVAWLDGAFLPLEDARVPVMDRGFLFADGLYEVTTVLDGRLIDSASHLARLQRSADALEIALPLSLAEIEAIERELIARNGVDQGTVYLQLTRGVAERNFLPAPDLVPTLLMFTQVADILGSKVAETGIAVATMADIRWARRDIKSVMLLAQVLAKRAAAAAGAQEAWLIEDGFVTEGASSSATILTADGVLVTRPDSHAILPGCTRNAMLRLAAEEGLAIEHRAFTLNEALAAREAMMTSASTFVTPIVRIDGAPIGDGTPGPVAGRLRALYIEAARAQAL
ncbi:D-amino-acid transaminase [Sphingomonas nostoxanthinifaciens]|uniref:D-amino-acid transaminase n=1 Tax=Sphingomonas nostoxanthinifaciens TaxID=2872652 RepID=UPI001CC1FFB6|nr:D-amino-acid transaminase [Sphingomonas nostoxanthinifaciens]UAK24527.1 D-amino-acid transaminase [Sphingomonas nostoxanthinifaciens]